MGEILQERNTRTSDFESNPLYSLTIESGVTPKTDRYERSSLVTKTEDLFKTVKPNEFVTNPMNLRFGALGYNKNAFTVSVSGYYDVFSIDDDKCSGFWNAYFKTPTAMNIFDNAATGSLIEKRRVKYSTLQQLAFYMPNDLSEKAEIGKYMDTFDHLITLHQRKFDKLQVLKKAMFEKMFPKNGSSVPEIRFKGFTDAWEQRKLGEIATFINGRAYSQPELLSSGKYKVLRVGNFYTNDSWYYSDLELGEKYYADYGDLLYTWSATFGPHIWLGDRVIYHYHIWKINLSDQLEKQFAVQLLEQDRTNILSSKNGSTMVHITKEGMEQKDVIIPPSTKEQQEIGAFFLQLDNLITLHQRELEKLQNIKKSMLEKMFV